MKEPVKTLSQQVSDLESQNKSLMELIGEIMSTIYVNRARGTLTSADETHFNAIIQKWRTQLDEIRRGQ